MIGHFTRNHAFDRELSPCRPVYTAFCLTAQWVGMCIQALQHKLHVASGSQLAGLVQYLQKRLRTLEGENTSLEQLSSRLKSDLEAASKRATQADQARLETAEKLQNSLRSQADQQRLMEQVQENNLLRESNVTLRYMCCTASLTVKVFQARLAIRYVLCEGRTALFDPVAARHLLVIHGLYFCMVVAFAR